MLLNSKTFLTSLISFQFTLKISKLSDFCSTFWQVSPISKLTQNGMNWNHPRAKNFWRLSVKFFIWTRLQSSDNTPWRTSSFQQFWRDWEFWQDCSKENLSRMWKRKRKKCRPAKTTKLKMMEQKKSRRKRVSVMATIHHPIRIGWRVKAYLLRRRSLRWFRSFSTL